MRTIATLTGLALAVSVLATGCASTGRDRAEHYVDSIQDTVSAVDAFGSSRTTALGSMDMLVGDPVGNLQARFEAFDADVQDVVAADRALRDSVASLEASASARNRSWGEDNASYADNEMQVSTQKSRAESAEAFRRIKVETDILLVKSAEFVTYLSDLRRILSNNLTVQGIEGNQVFATKTRASSVELDELSAALLDTLGRTTESVDTTIASE